MKAIITGANGDIGFALLKHMLNQGFMVIGMDKSCENITNFISNNSAIDIVNTDLSCVNSISSDISNFNNPIDVFIHAAGIREIIPMTDLNQYDWERVLMVNLTSAFILSQHFVRLAKKYNKPLCLIFISSISGLYGEPNRSAYCASKHGLIGLAKSIAIELAPHSIRSNVIAPGIIDTKLTSPYKDDQVILARINKNIPLGRWGKPEHIVSAADMIIKNDYLTGSVITVDGGWCAGKQI